MKTRNWMKSIAMMLALVVVLCVGSLSASAKSASLKKGVTFTDGKLTYVVTSVKGKTGTVKVISASRKATSVKVPETVAYSGLKLTVNTIAGNAFKDCKKLKKVTTGKTLKTIGKNAFSGCRNLKTLDLSKSTKLKTVGKNALKDASKVKVSVPAARSVSYYSKKLGVKASRITAAKTAGTAGSTEKTTPAETKPAENAPQTSGSEKSPAPAETEAKKTTETETVTETKETAQAETAAETKESKQTEANTEKKEVVESETVAEPETKESEKPAEPEEQNSSESKATEPVTQDTEAETKDTGRALEETKPAEPQKQDTPSAEGKDPQPEETDAPKEEQQTETMTEPKEPETPQGEETEAPQTDTEASKQEPKAPQAPEQPEVQDRPQENLEDVHGEAHEFTVRAEEVAPTCDRNGYIIWKCTKCEATKSEFLSKTEHTWKTENIPADCTNYGRTYRWCTTCGYNEGSEGMINWEEAPTGHSMQVIETVNAECDKAGHITSKCAFCGKTETTTIPALGHDYSRYEGVSKAATCKEEGTSVWGCSRCGATTEKSLPKTDHHWNYRADADEPVTCHDCGAKQQAES